MEKQCYYTFEGFLLNIINKLISLTCNTAQPGKSLYTTMRELVENALDSAESISELPDIEITM
jgi:hypothetical protein